MSILDELKKMTRPYDDDDDMMDDDLDMDGGYDEQPAYIPQAQPQQPAMQQVQQPVMQQPQQPVMNAGAVPVADNSMDALFGGIGNNSPDITKFRVMLIQPEQFDCATEIADALRKGDAVILNCEATDKEVARRVVDFLSGCAYALDGDIKKAANHVYIIVPSDVGVDAGEAEA